MRITKTIDHLISFSIESPDDWFEHDIPELEDALESLESAQTEKPEKNWKIVCNVEKNVSYKKNR
jgi:hypothetical protein